MRSQLYLSEKLRCTLKKELTYIYQLYNERLKPVFADAEKEAEQLSNDKWSKAMDDTWDGEADVDFGEIEERCMQEGLELYEILSLMRYRTLALWISCLCQAWEQQLMRFINQEINRRGCTVQTFGNVKCVFGKHGFHIEKLPCWEKIKELRHLVNVIKHSEGRSADCLRKLRPDLFEKNSFLGESHLPLDSTLLDETLDIKEKDFEDYYRALIAFWDEIPSPT